VRQLKLPRGLLQAAVCRDDRADGVGLLAADDLARHHRADGFVEHGGATFTEHAHDIEFPLIVKPVSEDGSIGIDSGSVVDSVKELMERIHYLHEEFDSPALIEEYIEGREIYAAILGNDNAEVLPLIELDLSRLPKGAPRIAGQDVKFDQETEAFKLTKSAPADDLDEETTKKLQDTALAAYRALKLRDYGRIDMRLNKKGQVYVIEANPNPWLASAAEFTMAARKAGYSYADMIEKIVELARARSNS